MTDAAPTIRARARPAPVQPVAIAAELPPHDADTGEITDEELEAGGEALVSGPSGVPSLPAPLKTKAKGKGKPKPFKLDGEIAKVIAKVETKKGAGVIYQASNRPFFRHIPLGVYLLDNALLGGMPVGCATYVKGWKHSGKSTLGFKAIAAFQRYMPDEACSLVDIEGTYDPIWGAKNGIDNDRLVLIQPTSGEDALDIADAIFRARETSLLVVDSLAGLMPTKELEAEMDQVVIGRRATMIRRFCQKAQQAMIDERRRGHFPTLYMVNQFTMQIGVTHGDPRTEPGGKAPGFLASIEFEIKNKEGLVDAQKRSQDGTGGMSDLEMVDMNEHTFAMKKNKLGNGPRVGVFHMVRNPFHPMGEGFIDDAKTVLTDAKRQNWVTGGGASWRIDGCDKKFGNGDAMVQFLYEDREFFETLKFRLMNRTREILKMCPLDTHGFPTAKNFASMPA